MANDRLSSPAVQQTVGQKGQTSMPSSVSVQKWVFALIGEFTIPNISMNIKMAMNNPELFCPMWLNQTKWETRWALKPRNNSVSLLICHDSNIREVYYISMFRCSAFNHCRHLMLNKQIKLHHFCFVSENSAFPRMWHHLWHQRIDILWPRTSECCPRDWFYSKTKSTGTYGSKVCSWFDTY